MNKKYYRINEDRWELPNFDEYIGKKRIGSKDTDYDLNFSDFEWEDFDNSDINWSGMSYRTKEERERDDKIISYLKDFYDNTKSIRVTGEDKLKEGKWYSRISFPRWSTKTKKFYKKFFEDWYRIKIDLNKDNTDEIRRLIKYYPEYNPSKYLFFDDTAYTFYNKLSHLTDSLLCMVEILFMKYNGKELIPISKNIMWNNKFLNTFRVEN